MENDNNTLRPELVWIDRRCYRFNESGAWSKDRGSGAYKEESMYLEEDGDCYDSDQGSPVKVAEEENDIDVQFEGGKFKHSFYVAKPFFPFLIGTKGSTRKRLEIETSTTISIPKLGQDGNIVLKGSNKKKVISARHRIDNLIKSSRKKLYFTHFLSIPANSESIQLEYKKFKESILNADTPMRGVDESIFQNPKKVHLTIGMMVLVDNKERQEAIEALERCKEEIIKPILEKNGPITISLMGVDYWNDDPTEVRVLYAKVHSKDGILQELADKVADYFFEIGILRKESDTVKLHVTLMNTSFRKSDDQRRGSKPETFDISKILKDHKDTKFGEFVLDTVHISQRHSTASDGYYTATGKISL